VTKKLQSVSQVSGRRRIGNGYSKTGNAMKKKKLFLLWVFWCLVIYSSLFAIFYLSSTVIHLRVNKSIFPGDASRDPVGPIFQYRTEL